MEFPLLNSFIPHGWMSRKKPQSELFDSMYSIERVKKQQNKKRLNFYIVKSYKFNARLKNLLLLSGKHQLPKKSQLLFPQAAAVCGTKISSHSKGDGWSKKLNDDTNHQICVDLDAAADVNVIPVKEVNVLSSGRECGEENTFKTSTIWGQNFTFVTSWFAGNTTAHGYKNIISENRGNFQKLAWIAAIVTVTLILIHMISKAMIQHQTHSFTSSVRSQPSKTLPFPTVTVCNPNPWNQSVSKGLHSHIDTCTEMEELVPSSDVNGSITVDRLQFPFEAVMDSFFANCSWGKQAFNCAHFFMRTISDVAGCYSFNWNRTTQRHVDSAGSIHGLSIKFNLNNLNGIDAEGIKVVVHDPEEVPNVLGKSILVGTGNMAHIGLQRHEYKFLPRPFRAYGSEYCEDVVDKRTFNHQQKHERYSGYSQCLAHCRYDYIIKRCHCRGVAFSETDYPDVPYCRVDQIECFNEARANTTRLGKEECACPLPCNRREYSWRMSASHFRKDSVVMKIFYEDLFTRIEEHLPMSTWLGLLGTIGGNMGLLTGASVLTMIEFLEFAVIVSYHSWRAACQNVKQKMGKLRRLLPV